MGTFAGRTLRRGSLAVVLLLLAFAGGAAGRSGGAHRSNDGSPPTWRNLYDWAGGDGYAGWHARASSDAYGTETALGGRYGLWLWPLGGHAAYAGGDGAEWTYTAPGTTRLRTAQLSYAWSNKLLAHHCLDLALLDGAGGVVDEHELCQPPPQSPQQVTLTDGAADPTAKVLVFRIRVDCGGASSCSRTIPALDPSTNGAYARLLGADLTLVDDDAPTLAPAGRLYDLRGTYVDGSATYDATVAAADAGSGIASAWLERQGYQSPTGILSSQDAPCDPTHHTDSLDARICPASFSYATSVDTRTLAEGTSHFLERARDVAGNVGTSAEWVLYVDRTGPSAPSGIVLAGFDPGAGTAGVDFERTSSDPALPDGPAGSGVAGYEERTNSGGGWSDWAAVADNSFDVGGLSPGGTLDVEVRAYDAVGNRGAAASATLDLPAAAQYGDTQLDTGATAPDQPDADPTPDAALADTTDSNAWNEPLVFSRSQVSTAGGEGVTVDRAAIVSYAESHVGVVGGDLHGGAHPWSSDYVSFPNDCQNFVSQALFAGGWPTIGDQFTYSPTYEKAWWYVHSGGFLTSDAWSYSWSAVIYFMRFVQAHPERGSFVRYWSRLRPGDVIQVDWQQGKYDKDGPKIAPTHSMLVTGLVHAPDGSLQDILLTYHTTNRLNYSLAGLQRQYPHAVWWGIHLANAF